MLKILSVILRLPQLSGWHSEDLKAQDLETSKQKAHSLNLFLSLSMDFSLSPTEHDKTRKHWSKSQWFIDYSNKSITAPSLSRITQPRVPGIPVPMDTGHSRGTDLGTEEQAA